MTLTDSEQKIKLMAASDNVKMRDRGVIAQKLVDHGVYSEDAMEWAAEIIAAQVEAGLVTMIKDDLNAHIDALMREHSR